MAASRQHPQGGLGTFAGVFTPSILTILGIILFLRLGYVVGNAGLARTLLILALATSISIATSMSLSAIATNRKVKGGGDYFLISRSLGVAYGGALGLILFIAQSVSVAFYCVGFGEAVVGTVSGLPPFVTERAVAAAAALLLFGLAYAGADLATRFQFVVMAVLIAALGVFFIGGAARYDPELLRTAWSAPGGDVAFWPLFAIFFPAVTGFTQGVSMSGDLASPARSLPTGTFMAIAVSTVVYVAAVLILAAALPLAGLASDYSAMKKVAAVPWLVDAGVMAATLSSALASFLGGPRILQALAKDGIFRRLAPFAAGAGPTHNPRRAVLLTAVIALGTIAVGNLNAIAGVVSMFFLLSYGLLNYATYVEATANSPSFRPRFRFFHARASLAGTVVCAAVMFAIDAVAAVVATAVLAAIYQYVRRTAVPARWRDSLQAYRFRLVRDGLHDLAGVASKAPQEEWQPQILAFTDNEFLSDRQLTFASWIAGGAGIVTAVRVVAGERDDPGVDRKRRNAERVLGSNMAERKLDGFALAVSAPQAAQATETLIQSWGVGPLRSNTMLLNVPNAAVVGDTEQQAGSGFVALAHTGLRLGQSVVVLDAERPGWERIEKTEPERRRIDVWWDADESSRLGLLLAYLMTRTELWDEAKIRLLACTEVGGEDARRKQLEERLDEVRIDAEVEILTGCGVDGLVSASADASVVFVPVSVDGSRMVGPLGVAVEEFIKNLPVTAMVAAADKVELVEPESEEPGPPQDVAGAIGSKA